MPEPALLLLAAAFLVVGALYSSVGHAGASGYLAVMALAGVSASLMRPTALSINVLVAVIASVQFWRAGHFRWRLFWPFAAASMPAAFLGGKITLPSAALQGAIGAVLILSAIQMTWTGWRRAATARERAARPPRPPPLWAALAVGAALGFVAGLTGTGGGIFLSPLLVIAGWAGLRETAATSAVFILVNSLAGLAGIVGGGWTPVPGLPILAAAAVCGGVVGSQLGSRMLGDRALRTTLAAVLLLAGGKLVVQAATPAAQPPARKEPGPGGASPRAAALPASQHGRFQIGTSRFS